MRALREQAGVCAKGGKERWKPITSAILTLLSLYNMTVLVDNFVEALSE
jgi:hypothetical protein